MSTNLGTYLTDEPIKMILMGNSGTGKTGSLASLVGAGYKLKILDFDRGLSSLAYFVKRDFPDKLENVDYKTFRDKRKVSGDQFKVKSARAAMNAMKALDKWSDEDPEDNLEAWTTDTVFVIDSLTRMSEAAFSWAEGMNPSAKDRRQIYGAAQEFIQNFLAQITGDDVHCHVIVLAHIDYVELEHEGAVKGFARSVGKALGPTIPSFFDHTLLAQTSGSGANIKRTIRTVPTPNIDVKTLPVVDKELPLETGLATFFEKVQQAE